MLDVKTIQEPKSGSKFIEHLKDQQIIEKVDGQRLLAVAELYHSVLACVTEGLPT